VAAAGFRPVPLAGDAAAAAQRSEYRAALKRIGLAGLGMMQTMMIVYCLYAGGAHGVDPEIAQYLKVAGMLIATPVLIYSGAPFFKGASRDLRGGALGMDVPVALALVLAYGASVVDTLRGSGEIYFDSVTMFIFFLLAGRFMEMTVRQSSLNATEALARSLPASVARILPDGTTERIAPRLIEPGDRLVIPRGAVIPVDATLAAGEGLVDESLLTGESAAVAKRASESLHGGSVNVGHSIEVIATTHASQSMLANIVSLLERTQAQRAPVARAADRVASWFILVTLTLAACVGAVWLFIEPARALPAALAVLVVTCPCALSLATPVAIAAATSRLARFGLLVTRVDALERLARVDSVIVDKTGTLTAGAYAIQTEWTCPDLSTNQALAIAAALERPSDHPTAVAFRPHLSGAPEVLESKEFAGKGVEGILQGQRWRLGSRDFVLQISRGDSPATSSGEGIDTGIVLGNASGIAAVFSLSDRLRPEATAAIRRLRSLGLRVAIASGDHEKVVQGIARQLGIADARGRLSPAQKLVLVEERQAAGARVLMVGDGINDGPVLAAAYVSCAMAQGSAVAQAAADLLLLNESLETLAEAVATARRMKGVIRQNLGWALAYNLAAVPMAALGWIPPWIAAIGMSASSLAVVLNAARLARAGQRSAARGAAIPQSAGSSELGACV
jgi:P-type Cu2+ transporter